MSFVISEVRQESEDPVRVEAPETGPHANLHMHTDAAESERIRLLYAEFFARACAYARKIVGDSEAEDVVQEAFLRITRYRSLSTQEINAPFVLTIVRNTAMTLLARRSQELRRRTTHSNRQPRETAAATRSESLDDKFLGELTDGQREALILVEVRGLSEAQASLALDISRPVVSAKKRSAVQALRALYLDDSNSAVA
jgi:RNA polymerase sigma factor (sigma-70 family)